MKNKLIEKWAKMIDSNNVFESNEYSVNLEEDIRNLRNECFSRLLENISQYFPEGYGDDSFWDRFSEKEHFESFVLETKSSVDDISKWNGIFEKCLDNSKNMEIDESLDYSINLVEIIGNELKIGVWGEKFEDYEEEFEENEFSKEKAQILIEQLFKGQRVEIRFLKTLGQSETMYGYGEGPSYIFSIRIF